MSEDVSAPSHSRRLAREIAFQALYVCKVGGTELKEAQKIAISRHTLAPDSVEFVTTLVTGVADHAERLDSIISPFLADGWTLSRIAISDHVILQIAAFEILEMPEMPPKVTISQAVELAKRFGSSESGRFVNGVLASLLPQTPKANWEGQIITDDFQESEPEPNVIELEFDAAGEEPAEEDAKVGAWVIKREDEPI